jgi:hypothetical protein
MIGKTTRRSNCLPSVSGWAQSPSLYFLLGITSNPCATSIPKDAEGEYSIIRNGTLYRFRLFRSGNGPGKNGYKRLYVECPDCGHLIECGHLGQHRGSKICITRASVRV